MKTNRILFYSVISVVFLSAQAFAADSGSCGENCVYSYDPSTQTLTYTGTGENGSGIISKTSIYYGLSGTVKNAIISEGITEVICDGHATLREIGTQDGKLVIPSTMINMGSNTAYHTGFGTVEVNSKNLHFDAHSLAFNGGTNVTMVVAADANLRIGEQLFYAGYSGWELPTNLHIACKGNPDACLAKFGQSLDRMNSDNITADYYEERDENNKLTLKYHDNGYYKYDAEGNITERWNLDSTEQHDSKGHIIGKYDGKGNMLQSFVYGTDNSVSIYDANSKLIGLKGKRILTVDEASALVNNNKNTFKLKYR